MKIIEKIVVFLILMFLQKSQQATVTPYIEKVHVSNFDYWYAGGDVSKLVPPPAPLPINQLRLFSSK